MSHHSVRSDILSLSPTPRPSRLQINVPTDGVIPGCRGTSAAARLRITAFPNALHGVTADYRARYHRKQAKTARAELVAWFRLHGAA
jgi:hypothetical protein